MPYAYVQQINHVFDTNHLNIYVTFRHQMQRSIVPQADPPVYDWYPITERWLLEADEVPIDILSSEWLDEFTLLLTSDVVASEPTGVTLAYVGPDEKLCYNWGKQIEPFGARESFSGYPATPSPHKSTHENGGADEINIAGLSGLAADTQHSFVNRGDPAAADFVTANFTADNAWHDLDLSTIIPTGVSAVLLYCTIIVTASNRVLQFRKKGNVNTFAVSKFTTQAAGVATSGNLIVSVDTNGFIQYYASAVAWTTINATVLGWWL
jgi:hypothetical protein